MTGEEIFAKGEELGRTLRQLQKPFSAVLRDQTYLKNVPNAEFMVFPERSRREMSRFDYAQRAVTPRKELPFCTNSWQYDLEGSLRQCHQLWDVDEYSRTVAPGTRNKRSVLHLSRRWWEKLFSNRFLLKIILSRGNCKSRGNTRPTSAVLTSASSAQAVQRLIPRRGTFGQIKVLKSPCGGRN